MSNIIDVQNVSKCYKQTNALDHLSLQFPEGQITGVLGPNGAGKSTLFKMIVGLTKPDSGQLFVSGHTPHWSNNSEIAYLPDRAQWYKFHTIEEALNYAKVIFPGFDHHKAIEMAKKMDLDFEARVRTLSKGQEARLHLILCLARKAKLVILDEPFSGIDLISRERIIQSIIDSTFEEEKSILISTHEIHEAESLFDHVSFIDQGQLVLDGNAEILRSEKGSIESIYRGLFR
ncbi:ABC transporter ATP-binding protein [Desulfitobacterium sp. AusDCA]|uniref:ABC transporter ATP-binding protein n=1 Tax=Desulfitobacterium sp. AusDCA TaxID=3240383 RepID=UPI003DA74296